MKACNQCGKCCLKYGGGDLAVTGREIELWESFRPDIYRYTRNGKIWTDPETGAVLEQCPWLSRAAVNGKDVYSCAIYDDRPEDCRHYPARVSEMIRDECEMIEVRDLTNRKRAQQELDVMMIDTRQISE